MISLIILLFFYTSQNRDNTVCESCSKQKVAGTFNKWVCLRKECSNYLK